MTKKKLVLSTSNNAKSLANTSDEFLQELAFEKVAELVSNNLLVVKETFSQSDSDFFTQRGHYNILVNGKRGSGKTTFAITALGLLESGYQFEKIDIKRNSIISLGILDPTLIDTKEHVLLGVIEKIKTKVEERYKNNITQPISNTQSMFADFCHPLDDWRNSLKILAQGLQQLQGLGNSSLEDSIWEDPVTIMEEGLAAIGSGLQLNQRLHYFINKSLEMLGSECFVIVLDDIDTFFSKGWPVLETLRKYLTSPKLITLVCGDLHLYHTQTRLNQWRQLGELVSKYETSVEERQRHEVMVTQLTEQYMLKLLPEKWRVDLAMVSDIKANLDIYTDSKQELGISFDESLNEMLKVSFKTASSSVEAKLYSDYINRNPLRFVVQLFQSLDENKKLPVSSLKSIFTDWVYKFDAALLLEESNNNPLLLQELLARLYRSELLADDFELLPRYIEDFKNSGSIIASRVLCSYFTANHASGLEFMLRFGLSRQAIYFVGESNEKRPSAERIMHALAATTGEDLLTVTRQWSPVTVHGLANATNRSIALGTVQLHSEVSFKKSRNKRSLKSLYRTSNPALVRAYSVAEIDTSKISTKSPYKILFKGMIFLKAYYNHSKVKEASQHYAISPEELKYILRKSNNKLQAELVGALFVIVSQGNSNFYRASFLNIISLLVKIIGYIKSGRFKNKNELDRIIKETLFKSGQIRNYPVPVDYSLYEVKVEHEEYEEYEEDEESDLDEAATDDTIIDEENEEQKPDEFVYLIRDWLQNWESYSYLGLDYPPFVWSRIWQRFYYTLERQENNFEPQHRYLGVIIHRQIVAFLNAVLVEERRYHIDKGNEELLNINISLDNPVLADDVYIKNHNSLQKNIFNIGESLPLYNNLRLSPLLVSLLEKGSLLGVIPKGKPQTNKVFDKNEPSDNATLLKQGHLIKVNSADVNTTTLYDLLNLISPVRDSNQSTPTLWKHTELINHVLPNTEIRPLIKSELEKIDEKRIKEFAVEHLSRINSAELEKELKVIKNE